MTASAEPAANRPPPPLAAVLGEGARARLALSPEAERLVGGTTDPAAAFASLVAGGLALDAVRLMSHALPKREAVWWSCVCARHTAHNLPPPVVQCQEAAELWVRRAADDAVRRAAFARAEAAGFASPEAWACVAAFWSGDSMAPPGQPAVPPAPYMVGQAVAGAVTLASVRDRPERQAARLAQFVASARDIAAGGYGRLDPEAP